MAAIVKFTATKLSPTKRGRLLPDPDGYYEIVVGGLNTFNSAGEYYVAEGARLLFEESNAFMRRVRSGCLKGEMSHPDFKPGMTTQQYIDRMFQIDAQNVCCHIKEVWLDFDYGRKNPQFNNPSLVAIIAKVRPSGPKGPFLADAFENGSENVCFSIRAITKDYINRGQRYRELNQIITWDWVVEPGLSLANKWDSPALEDLASILITRPKLESILERSTLMAVESTKEIVTESLKLFDEPPTQRPVWLDWK